MININTEITIMFVAYSALMLFIGFYFYKKNKYEGGNMIRFNFRKKLIKEDQTHVLERWLSS